MSSPSTVRERINQLAQKRILILDGAMGSMITERLKDRPELLKGCNDNFCLTMPELVSGIYEAYLSAGADIIETCSFNSTAVSLADYGLAGSAYEISSAGARLARKAADSFSTPEKPRFVAGNMGPTSKSLSMSPDINDPGKRAVTWDELEAAYYDNARGLLDGGADLIVIETIFDTLNAKAAIFAVKRLAEERGIDVPLIVSATVSENGGRLLAGQTAEAFCVSVLHAEPLALGLNCSFGAEKLKPHIASLAAAVPCLISAYPNAGLPNRHGTYDESPESMADHLEAYFREGLVNIVGGCCGSTPAHIAAIADRAKNYAPRPLPVLPQKKLLAGLEVSERGPGECVRLAENPDFLACISSGEYEDATDIARDMIEAQTALVEICMDDVQPDAEAAMKNFLNFALQFPDLARLPVMLSGSRWEPIEAGLKCLQGKALVNLLNLKEGEEEYIRRAKLARSYGAEVEVLGDGN